MATSFLQSRPSFLRTVFRRVVFVLETPLMYLFGRDIFISYARADAATYAQQLAIAVRGEVPKLSFFLDQWASMSGTTLPLTLRLALRWSQLLVFVGTQNAIGSAHVRMELQAFFNRKGRFVPIDVAGVLGQAIGKDEFLSAVCGPGAVHETSENVASAQPSKSVVTRVVEAVTFTRQDRRLRRAVVGTTLGVVAIIAGGYFVSRSIIDDTQAQASKAKNEAAAATDQRQKAETEMGAARFAAAMADSDQMLARMLANEANKEREVAEKLRADAERLRDQARAEAKRQGEIATSRQRANQSELTLKQSPIHLADSVALAVESVKRAHAVGMYSLEGDRALRSSLSLLPRSLGSRRIAEGTIADYVLSPEGKYMALLHQAEPGSSDLNLKIQRVEDGQVIAAFRQEETDAAVVALSNDARRVSVYDGTLVRTREISGSATWEREFTELIEKMALSPNGRYLALVLRHTDIEKYENRGTAQENATFAEVWDVESGKCVIRLPVGVLWLNSVAFSGNGQFLAVGGDGEGPGGVRMGRGLVWDLRGARQRGVLTAEDFRTPDELFVNDSTFNVVPASQDGYVAITTSRMATVWKRFMRSGYRELARIPVHQSIHSSAFNSEGNRLVLLSTGRHSMPRGGEYSAHNVEVWESQGYWQVAKSPHRSEIQALKFQPGDQFITTLTRYGENKVRAWNASKGEEVKNPKLAVADDAMAEFSTPDMRFVVLRDDKDIWSVRDVLDGSEIPVVREPNPAFRTKAVALTPDGTLLALGGITKGRSDGWVSIYKQERSAYRMVQTFPLPAYATWVAISHDRRYLAVSTNANGLQIIDLRSGNDIAPAELRSLKYVRSFKFAPNGEYLAVVFDSKVGPDYPEQFGVWRLRDFRQIATLSSNSRGFLAYVFSSGKEALLAVTKDNSIELFDLRTSTRRTLRGSTKVRTVAFSADGRLVAMGNDTGLVTIFEVSSGEEIAHLQHEDPVTNVAFSTDGKYVATSTTAATDRPRPGEEHLLHVWLLRPTDLITEACQRLPRFRETPLSYCAVR